MRISGTEPSSVILSLTGSFKRLNSNDKKVLKQAEAKWDGVINQQNYNFNQFQTRKMLILSKCYESAEVDRRTWLHVPSETHWSTSSGTNQVVEIQIETSTKMYSPFLNRIQLMTWTICAFRVLNPSQ